MLKEQFGNKRLRHRMATGWSLISDSADCYAATAARPDGLTPRDKLVADTETSHRSACSAQTDNHSLVIDDFEATNSRPNRLGAVCRHHGPGETQSSLRDASAP